MSEIEAKPGEPCKRQPTERNHEYATEPGNYRIPPIRRRTEGSREVRTLIFRLALRLRGILDWIFRDDEPDRNVLDPPGSRPAKEAEK